MTKKSLKGEGCIIGTKMSAAASMSRRGEATSRRDDGFRHNRAIGNNQPAPSAHKGLMPTRKLWVRATMLRLRG